MKDIEKLCNLVRYNILTSTTAAGSGHPSSSLSATDVLTELFFGGHFHYDLSDPKAITNDRIIFSKGHAAPLLYALYQAAGYLTHQELNTLRQFDSVLEGHPTPRFEPIEVSTGSLGQGLSVGMGMALSFQNLYKDESGRIPHVYVLMGDSEMAEGQIWEAIQLAGHYRLKNLIGIIDVNRLGQRGPTMDEWNIKAYGQRIAAFGWKTIVLEDGHDLESIRTAFEMIAASEDDMPTMIIAKTQKGYGVSQLANKDNWHGKPLPKDLLEQALKELEPVDTSLKGDITKPQIAKPAFINPTDVPEKKHYAKGDMVATREAYGDGLVAIGNDGHVAVLDAETSNSTFAEVFKKVYPERFFEMYIAEQNMVSTALGMSKLGYIPFVSTFSAFLTRAFDQIRMIQYAEGNVKIVGSHAGVSIGQDGSSQMGLEDLSMMRSLLDSVVLYPSEAVSTAALIKEMHSHNGISYMRLTREKTPVLYSADEQFPIGGSKVLHESENDSAVIIGAGITLVEAVKAYSKLQEQGTSVAVVDAYSIKPLDTKTIIRLAEKTKHVVVVEDHYPYGGLGEAVKAALQGVDTKVTHLCVNKIPRSGKPEELLAYEEIDAAAIMKAVS